MSVKRYYPGMISDDDPEDIEIAYVLHTDHLAAVEEARRAAFAEALAYAKSRLDPIGYLPIVDSQVLINWLKARAEGRGG